jgi:hypothetical protein
MSSKYYTAKTLNGTPCRIKMDDYGDTIPAFDDNGIQFEAYTTRFIVTTELVFYSIIDKDLSNGGQQRLVEDWAHLEPYIDMPTLKEINVSSNSL